MKKFSFLFAALCMALTMSATEVTVTIGDYAAANGWENSVQQTSLTMDEVVTVTANPTTGTYNNTGKYYDNGKNWRMYQNEAPAITVSAAEGYLLTSVTFTYASEKTGVMVDAAGAQVASAEAYALDNVASATFSVSNTNASVTNGQARITAITVTYEAAEETPDVTVPTNAELWEAFKPYYNTYYGLARADQPIDKVSTFAAAKMQEIMTDAASEYKWLGDYVLGVAAGQGVNLPTDMAAANEGAWRWAVHAFFNATTGANGAAGTDFTEAGKPENWGPYYLAAQTPVEPEPTTETVYFVNAANWTTVNVYAWTTDPIVAWPGAAATLEAEQIAGYDVYSYTLEAGAAANVIFNNGSGQQTADLVWTAGKYYVKDGWYTKEEAEAKLAAPVEYESVYFVDNQGWGKANIYTWTPELGTWPGVAMTKEAEQLAGYDVYSYTVEKGTSFGGVIFNNGSSQTSDLVWTAGKYYVKDGWYTKEEAEAKLAAPVVVTWTMVGQEELFTPAWTPTAVENDMEKQEDGSYVLVLENKTLKAGKYEYKAVKDHAWTVSIPQEGNYTLDIASDGDYTIEFTVNAAATELTTKVTKNVVPCEEAIAVNWDEPIALQANADVWYHLNLATAVDGGNDISVLLVNTSDEETEITVAAYENCPELDIITEVTKTLKPNEKLDGIAEYAEYLDGQVSEMYIHVTTKGGAVEVSAETVKPEIEWIPMDLEIANLATEEIEAEGAKYLLLQGRDDMNDADVMLFLNNYTGEDKEYEVNAENSYMTFGGIELTVLDGVMTKTEETYTGIVHTYAAEEGMYVEFALTMYAAPATELVITDAAVEVNEDLGTLTFKTAEYFVELSGYTAPGVHEGPQICLLETPEAVAFANSVTTVVEGGVITLTGEFTSFMGAKFALTISGKLPVVEPVEKPEPTYTENQLNTYAFGLESVLSEDAATLTVTYRLNNSNATSVNVVVYNGDEVVATVPGTTTIGVNTVEVATADLPGGVQLTWAVEVNGTSVEAPTQDEKMFNLYCPHGLAIDTDPESENFGRILVAEAMQGVPASGYVTSGKGAGLYVFNPSFTTDSVVYTGGNDFTRILASNGYQPWRVKISEDGRIFVSSLDLNGVVVWEVSKDLQTWTPVISGTNDATDHNIYDADGNFVAGINCSMDVTGKGEDLKLLLYSTNNKGIAFNQSGYRLDEYALGTATTWTGLPKNILEGGKLGVVHTNVEFIYDGEGGYWFGGSRAGNAGQPNLVHINAAGEQDYYTEDASLYGGDGVLLHNGMLFKGKARTSTTVGNFGVWTIGKDADGKVTLTEKWTVEANGIGRNLNEFAVDYAENLYIVGNSGEKIIAYALPYSGQVETPAAAKYAFQLPEPLKMAGVVKRAVQNGEDVVVLTHEADGTAHIYQVVDGKPVAELSQEGVIARDPENAGDLLAISDIAVTEDGKLVAINYMHTQAGDDYVNEGQKRGETRVYLWNDLAADPTVLFTSKMSSNWFRSKQGLTMAVKGTSDNMEIFTTGIHATSAWARVSSFRVINGVYEEPAVNHNDHYYFYDIADAIALETTVGTQYELNASPLGEMNWVLDAELINPTEIVESASNNVEIATAVALTEDLGKKYNGASYVTVGEQVLMVAPYATPDGKLNSVMILDITAGFDAPKYVDQLILEEAVEATAAATAVEVVEGDEATSLLITLVADATIYSLEATLAKGDNWEVYEEEITNLVIDLDNLVLIGGPSANFQVDVFLGLGEYNMSEDTYQLLPESSISVLGQDATFIEGYAYEIDAFAPSAKAVVRCEWNGMLLEFHLTMTAAPMEATVVVVEDAKVEIEKYLIFGDMYDYSLKMTGNWLNEADGLTYPVLVEVPVYYPESTEPSEIMSTVTVGGWNDEDPWLGFGEGTLTITTVDGVVTATGIVQNPMAGVAIDITISGKLPVVEPVKYTVTATVNPAEAGTVEGAGEYEENAEATLIATAAEGYEFVNWTVAGEEVSTDATYTFTVTADVEVVANFKEAVGTGVTNIQTGAKAVKVIKNGQLIINRDGKEYNAQGAIVK